MPKYPLASLALVFLSTGAAASDRPNVLLVSIDSLRRDALGCDGARLPHAPGISPTPHLDHLAATGVRMTDAYARARGHCLRTSRC